jgi:trigger factor
MTDTQQIVQNPLERRIDITVKMTDIERDVGERLKRIARTAKVPGFRPGKVPMKIVEQQYGGQARSDALGVAIEQGFSAQVREQNLRVAGYPKIEPKSDTAEGTLGFTAIFEIYPTITPADVSTQIIEKPILTVTDVEVGKTLDVLRKQRVSYVEADRPAQKEDRLVIDFIGRKNGEEFPGGKADGYIVVVGSGMMLPDFDAALEGVRAGECKTFDVTFPEGYQDSKLAGQTVQFEIHVKKVEMPRLPEVDAEFARSLGVADGNVEKMHAEVRTNLVREVKKRLQARVKQQVMNMLLAVNPIDAPKALVEMESQQMAEAARQDMESRGMTAKNIPVNPAWFVDQATRRVKLGLILAALVKEKELQVKPDHVRAIIDEFSETFEDPKEVVRWYYSQPQRLAEAEALALENNVVEWVLANANVIEKPVAFDELMGNAA